MKISEVVYATANMGRTPQDPNLILILYIYISTYLHIYIYICSRIYKSVCVYIYMYIRMHIYTDTYIYMHMCVCMCLQNCMVRQHGSCSQNGEELSLPCFASPTVLSKTVVYKSQGLCLGFGEIVARRSRA